MRRLLATLAWPVVMGSSMLTLVVLPGVWSSSAVMIVTGLVVALLERATGRPEWRPVSRELGQDLFYAVLSGALAGGLQLLFFRDAGVVSRLASERALMVLGGVVLSDAASWLAHLALHRVPLLWRVHAVHHAVPKLYGLNALHNHPLDVLFATGLAVAPLLALGFDAELAGAVGALSTAHFWFQHTSADVRLGWLNAIVSGPELHRWHHSLRAEESNQNYGMVFSMWDRLFRTWHAPDVPAQLGVDDAIPRTTLLEQTRSPFVRALPPDDPP